MKQGKQSEAMRQALLTLRARGLAAEITQGTGLPMPPMTPTGVMLPPIVDIPRPQPKKYIPIEAVPEDFLITIRVRMYALGALVWDYVDTVTCMATQINREGTKKLYRAIREFKADYDYFRRLNTDAKHRDIEVEWALDFEKHTDRYMKQLIRGIKQEMADAHGKIEVETEWFMIAVNQALCVLEALQVYTRGADKALTKLGVNMAGKTLLPKQFGQLATVLPEYGGDLLIRRSPIRRAVAENIAKELAKIVVCDPTGDLKQPEIEI